jgi:hypothetical protein
MSDTNNRANADGSLRGDDKDCRCAARGTGFNGDNYGASLEPGATNARGRIKAQPARIRRSATRDDPIGDQVGQRARRRRSERRQRGGIMAKFDHQAARHHRGEHEARFEQDGKLFDATRRRGEGRAKKVNQNVAAPQVVKPKADDQVAKQVAG